MKKLNLTNLGQIKKADIVFGDLTLFVGAQATGKSILLQLIKLLIDRSYIVTTLLKNGYDWGGDIFKFSELYFGEGMGNLLNQETYIEVDETVIDLLVDPFLLTRHIHDLLTQNSVGELQSYEQLFFMPSQRVLTLENGYPRPFTSFEAGNPFVIRNFSEMLRLIMQNVPHVTGNLIFPQKNNLTQDLRNTLNESIFHGAVVELDTIGMRRRIQMNMNGNLLPFMAWSAGQREFMPFLLSLYLLMPFPFSNIPEGMKWVVIEEPEMGLHPRAILSVILLCLELLNLGYRLIISTHSTVLLESIWAIRLLQNENPDPKYLYQLFDYKESSATTELFKKILNDKVFFTNYFDQKQDGVYVRDISSLDPFDEDSAIADWGGLTSFSSRASAVISQAIQEKA